MPSLQSLLPLLQAFSSSSGFYATNGIFIRGLVDGKRYTDIHTSTIRVSDQYQKVLPRANIDFRISSGDSRFWGNDFEPSEGKSPQSTESLPGNPKKVESNSQGTKLFGRLSSMAIAVLPVFIHYRHLQHQQI